MQKHDWNMQKCAKICNKIKYAETWLTYAEIWLKYAEMCKNMTEICRYIFSAHVQHDKNNKLMKALQNSDCQSLPNQRA